MQHLMLRLLLRWQESEFFLIFFVCNEVLLISFYLVCFLASICLHYKEHLPCLDLARGERPLGIHVRKFHNAVRIILTGQWMDHVTINRIQIGVKRERSFKGFCHQDTAMVMAI